MEENYAKHDELSNKKLIDVACGTGDIAKFFFKLCK